MSGTRLMSGQPVVPALTAYDHEALGIGHLETDDRFWVRTAPQLSERLVLGCRAGDIHRTSAFATRSPESTEAYGISLPYVEGDPDAAVEAMTHALGAGRGRGGQLWPPPVGAASRRDRPMRRGTSAKRYAPGRFGSPAPDRPPRQGNPAPHRTEPRAAHTDGAARGRADAHAEIAAGRAGKS